MGIYKVKDTWYIDFYADGRRIRKRVGSKKDAENALAAVKADILRGEYRFKRERNIRFKDFAKEYLEYSKANKRSWRSDQVSLNVLTPFFGYMRLSRISPRLIEEYKQKRINETKQRGPDKKISPATVNRELSCLKFMFSLAKKWKLIDENPVKEVKLFQKQKIEMKILDRDEIGRLIRNSCDHLKGIIILALNTGMRKGEILNLRWNDVDFDKLFIFIKTSKSGAARKVPMNTMVIDVLKNIKCESNYIFCNPKTKKRIADVKTAFKAACRRTGIIDLRFHDLRHTAATYMVTGGVDLVTVAEILGHADIKMTMRYAHPTPENKRKAVNVLDSIFSEKSRDVKKEDELDVIHEKQLISPFENN